jgi:hypothetical protein
MSEEKAAPLHLAISTPLSDHVQHMLRQSVIWFNAQRSRAEQLADILLPGRGGTSLRLIDHLVVQFSRDNTVLVSTEESSDDVPLDLWHDYRRTLNGTGKRYFDIFKRKHSIRAVLLGKEIDTTVGQLIFLSWYAQRGLNEYMHEHEKEIRQHMQRCEKRSHHAPKKAGLGRKKNKSTEAVSDATPVAAAAVAVLPPKKSAPRKFRAPSRTDCVKPMANRYTGSYKML